MLNEVLEGFMNVVLVFFERRVVRFLFRIFIYLFNKFDFLFIWVLLDLK